MHKPKRLISVLLVFLMLLSLSGTYLSLFEGTDTSGYAFAYTNEKSGNTASNTDKAAAEDSKQSGSGKGETTAPASNTEADSNSSAGTVPESNDKSSTDTKSDKTDKTEPVSSDRSEDNDTANDASDAQKEEASVSERVLTVEAKSEAAFEKDSEGNKKETAASKAARYFWKALTGRVVSHEKESDDGAYTVVIKGKLPEDVKAEAKYIEFDDADAYDKYGESVFFALNLTLTDADGNNYIPEEPLDITVSGFRIAESAKANDHFTLYSYEENYDRAKKYDRYSADVLAFDSEYTGNDSVTNRSYKVYDSSKEYKNGEDAVRYTEDSDGLAVTKKNEIEFTYAYGTSLDDSKEGEDAIVDSARFVLSARKLKKDEASKEEQKVIKAGRITASDGKAYSITVSYGKSAGIPEGAELKVKEITEKDKAYDAYMDASAEILNAKKKDFVIARAFDISIVDPETGKEYQPDDNVNVRIRLIDENVKWRSDIKIVHFEDSKGKDPAKGAELLEGKVLLTKAIEFETDGFSVFAVIDYTDQSDPQTFSVKYYFKYIDENNVEQDYMFPNEKGVEVNFQYVPNGEAPYNPGTPTQDCLNVQGTTFAGWFEKNGSSWASEPVIDGNGVGKEVTGLTSNQTKTLYPRFIHVKHVYYYDENARKDPSKPIEEEPVYNIDVVGDEEIIGNKYNTKKTVGDKEIYRVNYIPSSSTKAFLGWSTTPHQERWPGDIEVTNYDLPATGVLRLYPVVADVFWVTFDKNDWIYSYVGDNKGDWRKTGEDEYEYAPGEGNYSRKGSGATYLAPLHTLTGQSLSEAGYTQSDIGAISRPGYTFEGWYLPDGTKLDLNYRPTKDVTVKAKWKEEERQSYHVVFMRQVSSDEVGLAHEDKTYITEKTEERYARTGSKVYLSEDDVNGYGTGFHFDEENSTLSATVEGDGSTTLYVYYDRNTYSLIFNVAGNGYSYTPTQGDDGTQYGIVNGQFVQLTREEASTEYRYTTQYTYTPTTNNTGEQYGVINGEFARVYRNNGAWRTQNNRNAPIYGGPRYLRSNTGSSYGETRYIRTGSSAPFTYTPTEEHTGTQYGRVYEGHVQLNRTSTSIYKWYYQGTEYTGTRYKGANNQSYDGQTYHTVEMITALYGHSVNSDFYTKKADDTHYLSEYFWNDIGNPRVYSVGLNVVEAMPASDVIFLGSAAIGSRAIYYYVEVREDEDLPPDETREFKGKTYKLYKTLWHNYNYIEYQADYQPIAGFSQGAELTWPAFGSTMWEDRYYYSRWDYYVTGYYDTKGPNSYGTTSNPNMAPINRASESNYFYYNRESYDLQFWDSFDYELIATADKKVQYEQPLKPYENAFEVSADGTTITYKGKSVSHEGYVFDGWYEDASHTKPFDFDKATMPNGEQKIYAGWKKLRYRVWVQPNGGELSNTESTYFKVDWNEMIQEYKDVGGENGRGRVYERTTDDDPLGIYSYVYNDDPDIDWRVAYYKETSKLGPTGKTVEIDGEHVEIDEHDFTDGYRYKAVNKGTYAFLGWYKVGGEIKEDEAPDLGRDVDGVWNFNTPVTSHTAIKAIWRRNGTFQIKYSLNMKDGDTLVEGETKYQINDDNVYLDLAKAVAPTAVKVKDPQLAKQYVFAGWRTPDGNVHQPGQVFEIKYDYAVPDPNNPDHYLYNVEPYFMKIDSLTLKYDLNGGSYEEGSKVSDLGEAYDSDNKWIVDYDNMTVSGITKNTKIKLSDARDADNKLPTKKGFVFTGWNSSKDPEAEGAIHYDICGKFAVSKDKGSQDSVCTLYAEWTPICFDFKFTKFAEEYDPATDTSKYIKHLNGARFKLSATTDNTFADMTSTSATVEGNEGIVKFETVAPRSNRILSITETKAPSGYSRNKTEYSITGWKEPPENYTSRDKLGYTIVTIDGKKYVRTVDDSEIKITDPDDVVIDGSAIDDSDRDHKIVNEVAFNTVELLKFDSTHRNKYLAKARFLVTRKNSNNEDVPYIRGNHLNGIYITGTDGIAEMNLMPGVYTVTEVKAPAGYERLSYADGEYLKINVSEDGEVSLSHSFNDVSLESRRNPNTGEMIHTVKVPNIYKPGRKVILRKVSAGTYNPVQGQKFTVYTINGNKPVKADGTELKNLTSGADGIIWIGILPYGEYKVVETSQGNTEFEIEVNADHVVTRDVSGN